MSNLFYKNPLTPVQVSSTYTVGRNKPFGTNFSVLGIGGYMEVFNLSNLAFTIPAGQTGNIEISANTIPIHFKKGTGSAFSFDVLTLNSDNISSGRRRLGMLVYVYETNKIYQYTIENYDTLWSAATGATGPGGSTVVISDFGTTVKNNTIAGQNFINSWTASTIEGVSGYTNLNATWRELKTGGSGSTDTYVTGFTLSSNTITLSQNRNDQYSAFTITLTGITGTTSGGTLSGNYLPLSGGTVTGGTVFNSGLTANTISATTYFNLPTDIRVTGGTYSSGSATFTNNTGGTFNVTGFYTGATDVFTTGATYNNNTFTFTNNTGGTYSVLFNTVTGVTVNGELTVTGNTSLKGLTATTISATTYQNLPVTADTFVTGFTFNTSNYNLTINQNNGQSPLTQSLSILASDLNVTGGTYNSNTGVATFTNNTGGTFQVTGFLTGFTDTLVTAFTYNNNTFTITDSRGTGFTATINTMTGLTATTISATTYQNVNAVTGGSYSNGSITLSGTGNFASSISGFPTTFINDYLPLSGGTVTGGTIFQSGVTANTISATTYLNLPVTNFTGGTVSGATNFTGGLSANTFSATTYLNLPSSTFTGGTVNGPTNFTSGLTANTISATTYQNLPVTADTFVTGFTLTANTITLTQNRTDQYSSLTISLSAYTGSSSTSGAFLPLSGGTVTGNTIFQSGLTANTLNVTGNTLLSGLTANTISATTYLNLPSSAFTGGTVSGGTNFTNGLTASTISATTYYNVSSNFQYEIHVSQVDGSDTTGNGTLLNPVASITKGLTLVGSQRKTVIVHPGTYTESPSITVQYTTITGPGLIGGNIVIAGTVSTNNGCTISGIKMTNLTITASAGTGNVNILNCEVSGTLTKSGNADYTVLRLCDYGAANITGGGLVAIFGGNPNFTTVNNAIANVIIKSSVTVSPVLTNGTLSLVDSVVGAAVTNAVTSSASTVITLANCQFLTSALNNVAPIVLNGFYSILNCVFDKPNSTLVALSATGGSTNSIDYFQYINADKFITQGGTSLQYVMGDGSLSNGFTGGTVSGATNFTNGLTATTISATTYQNLPTDIRTTGGTYSNNTFTFTNNTGGTYSVLFNTVTGLTANTLNVTGNTLLSGLTASTISATTYQNLPDNITGKYLPLSGGTVTGGTVFNSGLTANTISATTYQNLPTDIRVTGGTYTNGTATFRNNTGGTFDVSGFSIGGGGGQIFYLNLSQSQNGNRLLSTTASTASEQTSGVTIGSSVTGSIASFQTTPLNISLIPGGIWSFYLHSYKQDNNSSFNIFVEVYKITSGGNQTLLFATDPAPVTTNSPNPSMQLTDGYFSGTSLNVSDGVVAVVKATNTDNQSHSITLVTEGSQHYSYVVSTIPTQQGLTCDTLSGCSIIQTINTNISNKFDKSGGTVSGATNFTSGLTANTISATTYSNLPSQSGTGISAFAYVGSTGLLTITKNDTTTLTAGTFNYVTAVTESTNVITVTSNGGSPSTYTIDAVTGGSYTNGTLTLSGTGNFAATITGFITGSTGGAGITWNNSTTAQTASINNAYVSTASTLTTITLPTTSAFGSVFEVTGLGTGGWKIVYNSGQYINFGNITTTTTSGSLASSSTFDSVRLVCVSANTVFNVVSSIGNITYI
jgi:hypothetical protein